MTKKIAKKKASKKKAVRPLKALKPLKVKTDWIKLDSTATILREFSRFLESIEQYRKAPKYSKELVQNIFKTWSATAAKEEKRKHQANLIKGFADFLA